MSGRITSLFVTLACMAPPIAFTGCSSGLEAELARTRDKLMQLEVASRDAQKEADRLSAKLSSTAELHKITKMELDAANKRIAELEATTKPEADLSDTTQKLEKLAAARAMTLEEKEAQIQKLRGQLDMLEKQLAESRRTATTASTAAATEKQREIRKMQQGVAKSEDLLENAIKQLEAVLKQFPSSDNSDDDGDGDIM